MSNHVIDIAHALLKANDPSIENPYLTNYDVNGEPEAQWIQERNRFLSTDASTNGIEFNIINNSINWMMFKSNALIHVNNVTYFLPTSSSISKKVVYLNESEDIQIVSGEITITGSLNYALLAPNGKIYCISTNGSFFTIDVTTNTIIDSVSLSYSITQPVMLQNGKIYCPCTSGTIGCICIDTNTNTCIEIGSDFTGTSRYNSSILASNGKIYCPPYDSSSTASSKILCIDTNTNTVSLLADAYTGTNKWRSSILALNGKIYCIPYTDATRVLCINPSTNTASLIGTAYSGNTKWASGVLAPNGKIYCPPCGASSSSNRMNYTLCIDPETDTTSLIGDVFVGSLKYMNSCLGSNGKIYCAPYGDSYANLYDEYPGQNQVLCIDPETDTTSLIGDEYIGNGKWTVSCLAPNGKIYCAPYGSEISSILSIDTATNKTDLLQTPYLFLGGPHPWQAGALAPNNKIYVPPRDTTHALCIDIENEYTYMVEREGQGAEINSGSFYGALSKWVVSCLAPNGHIYCPPGNANYVLKINTDWPERVSIIGPNLHEGTNADIKWQTAILAPNGKIYCAPYCTSGVSNIPSNKVLCINPDTDEVTLIKDNYSGYYKWLAAVLAPNGKIYCPPYSIGSGGASSNMYKTLCIDTNTDTTSLIGDEYIGGTKWRTAVLAPNGKIYCAPYGWTSTGKTDYVLKIDPETDTTSLIGDEYTGASKWIDSCLAPNGKIYCLPYSGANYVLKIDPATDTTSLIGDEYTGSMKWEKMTLWPDGKIYCMPITLSGKFLCIDPETDTTSVLPYTYTKIWKDFLLTYQGKFIGLPITSGSEEFSYIDTKNIPKDPSILIDINKLYF